MRPKKNLKIHPLADQFPTMSDLEYRALKADIAENGLADRIVLFEGKILDGRNRYRACLELGIEVKTTEFEGNYEQAAKLSASANLTRRHLSKSQKAMFVVKNGLAKAPSSDEAKATIRDAAKRYGVNHMTIYKAFYVYNHAPELAKDVLMGKLSVGRAESKLRADERRKPVRTRGDADVSIADLISALARIAALLETGVDEPTRKSVFGYLESSLRILAREKKT